MPGEFSFGDISFAMTLVCRKCRYVQDYVATMPVTSNDFKGTVHLSYSAGDYTPVGPPSIYLDEGDTEYVNVRLVDTTGQGGASVLIITGVSGSEMDTEEGPFGSS